MTIPQKMVGPEGPTVGQIAHGSWHTWNRMSFDEAGEFFEYALDAGVNLFDVGHYDSGLHKEGLDTDIVFGRILAASSRPRDAYAVAVKVWLWNRHSQPLHDSYEADLERIGLDFADIAIAGHFRRENPEMFGDDLDAIIREMAALVVEGKARCWGVCDWSAADLRRAFDITAREGLPRPQLTQLKYGVARRTIAEGAPYASVFDEFGVSLQPSDCLEGGFLIGKQHSDRRVGRDAGGILPRIQSIAPAFAEVAEQFGATPAQLAIAFALSHPNTSNVLVGASSLTQLRDNLGAIALYEQHSDAVRDALADYWLDRDVVKATDWS